MGCCSAFREDDTTESTLMLLDHLKVDYTLIDEVCCSGVLEDVGFSINEDHVKTNIDRILATGAGTILSGPRIATGRLSTGRSINPSWIRELKSCISLSL